MIGERTETNNKMLFQVLEVKASCRTGEENLMSCLRKALQARYGEKPVALGGVFLVEKGKANLHIMVCVGSFTINVLSSVTVITCISNGHYSDQIPYCQNLQKSASIVDYRYDMVSLLENTSLLHLNKKLIG